ncbi:hypothetical protein [Adhaeretor mobilis]|uniref:Uncharacterized protein n=1 Tax=Adhaeretor mobilis TaxID=1930276 RepID=A0A517MS21_9BACT|nr:hypothetical protein [Adhaeretor mobilis]QDS97683.1 hypothetical protein HG15A2_09470 [Adhaeretor mobilis]
MDKPLINDDLWKRRGISILWDADSLNSLCRSDEVISLRHFRQLFNDRWSDVDASMVDEETLVVAGLESCIDALPPEEATKWLQDVFYKAMVSYQGEVADGGTQAALILWFVDSRRLKYRTSDDGWSMHCAGEFKGQQIPLGRCLFNGAAKDLKEIQDADGNSLGLYHPRIS